MTTYCKSCGEGIEYQLKTPILCPFCGKGLSSVAVALNYVPSVPKSSVPVNTKRRAAPTKARVIDNDDEDDNDEVIDDDDDEVFTPPVIGNDSFSIILDTVKSQKLLDLAVAGATSKPSDLNRPPEEANLSKEQILEQFRQEAGTNKKNI